MSPTHYFGIESAFPQTTGNRPVSDILDDLADYVGGGDRPEAKARARRSLQAAVRGFNTEAWRFTRTRQTITLLNNTSDYTLNSTFRSPRAAVLLDAAGKAAGQVDWVPYEDWARYEADEGGTATGPEAYTCRNAFSDGLISFIPRLGTINPQYPSVRLDFHARITIPATDDAVLPVPIEVEEAIVAEGVAIIVAKTRSFVEARIAQARAVDLRRACWREWRDYNDSAAANQA